MSEFTTDTLSDHVFLKLLTQTIFVDRDSHSTHICISTVEIF